MEPNSPDHIISLDEPVLVTGSTGFIGTVLVERLLARGFRDVRCLVRPSSNTTSLRRRLSGPINEGRIKLLEGNLLSAPDCVNATRDVAVTFHLAAARGEKSVPDAFMNSVVTTRNLLDALVQHARLKRFVNVSSFSVYSNHRAASSRLMDEASPFEERPDRRGDAYCFAKVKQDDIVRRYGTEKGLPFVVVRPGYVYGPGNLAISGRVGIGTFGVFLHLGGRNPLPLTYVDNCVEAILLAGLKTGVDGEVFNVVDDDVPTSRQFLRMYKKHVRPFRSIYLPHALSYMLCRVWESYSKRSQGQLPPSFNRYMWAAYWKRATYSNAKLKERLGWRMVTPTADGLQRYWQSCRESFAR